MKRLVFFLVMALVFSMTAWAQTVTQQEATATLTLKGQQKVHVVRPGETLAKIAAACGVTVEQLLKENLQIADKNAISAGQELKLPFYSAPPVAETQTPINITVSVQPAEVKFPRAAWYLLGGVCLLLAALCVSLFRNARAVVRGRATMPRTDFVAIHAGEDIEQWLARIASLPGETRVPCPYSIYGCGEEIMVKNARRHLKRCAAGKKTAGGAV